MAWESLVEEVLKKVSDAIGGDGVHADDEQRKRPAALLGHIDYSIKCGQEEAGPAAAEQYPGGGPNPLHHGANPERSEQAPEGQSCNAGNSQPLQLTCGGTVALDPPASDEAQDHRAQGGDKAEGGITASIGQEGFFAGEQVEKPFIESPGQVA